MAYQGYLIKIGSYVITGAKYISEKSYSVSRKIQDLDSYRDANGVLHRNALSHVPLKIQFETMEDLTNTDVETFWGTIRSQFTNANERKVGVTAFVPETNSYITQDMYIADPEFKINRIINNVVYYDKFTISLTGY